jgi:proton-coupled amino acid transporter
MVLPKNFENGGWLVGVLAINLGVLLVGMCALKLIKCAIKIDAFDFREVCKKALGSPYSDVITIILAVVNFSFTIAQISFTLKAVQTITHGMTGYQLNQWFISIGIIMVYSPLAWVRKIAVFAKGFQLAMIMILISTVSIIAYSVWGLATTGPVNDGFHMFNEYKYWDMVGFSFYTFEGIGCLLPIMKESQNPERFPTILKLAMGTLALYMSLFACVAYKYFGTQAEPIVINNIDEKNLYMQLIKLLFCVNLVFSYPMTIFPTNKTIDEYVFKNMKENTALKYWTCNFSRVIVCFLACLFSI